ncbi:MAG: tetratricopeptide repeat protein [Nitrospirae bacterium]|nr:tetratricopeptide repeat protein [Nitrospirota bacterium]
MIKILLISVATLVLSLSLASGGVLNATSEEYMSGEIYFLQGKWQKAIRAYEALDSIEVEELLRLSDAYIYLENYKSAKETLESTLKVKDNPDFRVSLAMLKAIEKKKYLKELDKLFKLYSDNPRLWRSAGIAYMKHGFDEKALSYFNVAVEKDPTDYMSYFFIGNLFEIHYAFDDAIEAYKKSLKINPDFAQALNNLGYNYKERHYYTYAIQTYKRAIEVDPDNAGYYYNIGNAYSHKDMTEEAYASYRKALELEPTFAKAHYNMGRTYLRMNMLKEALDEFKLYVKYWDPSIPSQDAPHPESFKEEIKLLEEALMEQTREK